MRSISVLQYCLGIGLAFGGFLQNSAGAGTVVAFSDNFESGTASWALSGIAHVANQSTCPNAAPGYASPTRALIFSESGLCTYGDNQSGYATRTTSVAIPATAFGARLKLGSSLVSEGCCDKARVAVSTDNGATWTDVFSKGGSFPQWRTETVDLSDYIGQSIRVRLGFTTDFSVTYAGWWVDDATLEYDELNPGDSIIRIEDASLTEGDSGQTNMLFAINISPPNPAPLSLVYEVLPGSAVTPSDFLVPGNQLEIPVNSSSVQLAIPVVGDEFPEEDESFEVEIASLSAAGIVTRSRAVGTILNDEVADCVFEDNFDFGSGAWNSNGAWQLASSSVCTTTTPPNGWPVVALVDEADCEMELPGGGEPYPFELIDEVEVPSSGLNAYLSFDYLIQNYDGGLRVEASKDAGQNWQFIGYVYGGAFDWTDDYRVSLSNFKGTTIKLRFTPFSYYDYLYGGILLDDVRLCSFPVPTGYVTAAVPQTIELLEGISSQLVSVPVQLSGPAPTEIRVQATLQVFPQLYGSNPTLVEEELTIPTGAESAEFTIAIPADEFVENIQYGDIQYRIMSGNALFGTNDYDNSLGYTGVLVTDDDSPVCLFEDDFESGGNDWDLSGPWHIETSPLCTSPRTEEQPAVLALSGESSCEMDPFLGLPAVAMLNTAIELPESALRCSVQFWAQFSGDYTFDPPRLEVSVDNGQNWRFVKNVYAAADWQQIQADVTGLAGRTVLFRLNALQQAEYFSGAGWYFDDFSVCYEPLPDGYHLLYVNEEVLETDDVVNYEIPVRLVPPAQQALTFSYSTHGYFSSPGVDYVETSGDITIPAGESETSLSLTILGDTIPEGGDQYVEFDFEHDYPNVLTVQRSIGLYEQSFGGRSDVRIIDDDIWSSLFITHNGGEQDEALSVRVSASPQNEYPIIIGYATVESFTGVDAWEGLDYSHTAGEVTIDPALGYVDILIPVVDDPFVEGNETLTLQVSVVEGNAWNIPYTSILTILDNEPEAGTYLVEDFESGASNWTAEGLWHLQQESSCTVPEADGFNSYSTAMAYNDETFCRYTKTNNGRLQYNHPITLPSQAEGITLSWYDWLETGTGDLAQLLISVDDGQTFQTRFTTDTSETTWDQEVVDLSDLAGETIRIFFLFDANDDNNTYRGWYIDDVLLDVQVPLYPSDYAKLTISDTTVAEGSPYGVGGESYRQPFTPVQLTAQLDKPAPTGGISVDLVTKPSHLSSILYRGAEAGKDYDGSYSQTLTFLQGETEKAFLVPVTSDREDEYPMRYFSETNPGERFDIAVIQATGAVAMDRNRSTLILLEDDFPQGTRVQIDYDELNLRAPNDFASYTAFSGPSLFCVGAEFVGYDFSTLYMLYSGGGFAKLNLASREYTQVGTFSQGSGDAFASDLAFDPTTNTLYMLSNSRWYSNGNEASWVGNQYMIEKICSLSEACRNDRLNVNYSGGQEWMVRAIAVHPGTGKLYGLGTKGDPRNNTAGENPQSKYSEVYLVELNKDSAAIVSSKLTGISMQYYAATLEFDDATANLYARSPNNSYLYNINIITGIATVTSYFAPSNGNLAIASRPPAAGEIWANDVLSSDVAPQGFAIKDLENAGVAGPGGTNAAGVGDVDGDGFDDFLVAFRGARNSDGLVKLVFGPIQISAGEVLASALGSGDYPGVEFIGPSNSSENLGYCLSSAGDVNDDGRNDFLVGFHDRAEPNNGQAGAYLVYGMARNGFPATVNMGSLGSIPAATRPSKLTGFDLSSAELPAMITAPIGDFNGDFLDDFVIAAQKNNSAYIESYIVFGRNPNIGATLNLQNNATTHLRIETSDLSGDQGQLAADFPPTVVAAVGDFNGDGYDDVGFGAPGYSANSGQIFVLYGHPSYGDAQDPNSALLSPVNLLNIKNVNAPTVNPSKQYPGLRIKSGLSSARMGSSLSGVGDFDGDGYDDIVIGCPGYNGHGGAWLLKGNQSWEQNGSPVTLGTAPPSARGFFYEGFNTTSDRYIGNDDQAGRHVAGLGDVNADGYCDFAISSIAAYLGHANLGETYIIFGAADKDQPVGKIELEKLADYSVSLGRTAGITIRGMRLDPSIDARFGWDGVQSLGDLNDDGFSDFQIASDMTGNGLLTHHIFYGYSPEAIAASVINRQPSIASEFTNFVRPAGGAPTGQAVLHEPRPVGTIPSKSATVPLSRISIGFKSGGGAGGGQKSRQDVTLYREHAPDLGEDYEPAKAYWAVNTDRTQFEESTIVFHYRPEDLVSSAGAPMNDTEVGIFWSSFASGTVNEAGDIEPSTDPEDWLLMPTLIDTGRRTHTLSRLHQTDFADAEFNGFYALMKGEPQFLLGQEIAPVGLSRLQVAVAGPRVVPADAAIWYRTSETPGAGRLYAIKEGPVQIFWRDNAATPREYPPVSANIVWPEDEALYQIHVAESYPVSLTSTTPGPAAGWAALTTSEAGTGAEVSGESFTAVGPGRSMVMLAKSDPGKVTSDNRLYFQLIRTVEWFNPEYLLDVTERVDIGQPIPVPALWHKVPGAPFPINLTSRYCDRPGFYQRETRTMGTGGIVPVNLDIDEGSDPAADRADDLVVAYYEPSAKLLDTSKPGYTVPDLSKTIPAPAIEWPYKPLRYEAQWPEDPLEIVLSNQQSPGTGSLAPAEYGEYGEGPNQWWPYIQNDPELPGFNPNDEHAYGVALGQSGAVVAVRNDLETPITSKPFVLITYRDPADSKHKMKVWKITKGSFADLPAEAGKLLGTPAPLAAFEQTVVELPDSYGVSGPFFRANDGSGRAFSKAGSDQAVQRRTAGGFVTDNNTPVPIDYRYFYKAQPFPEDFPFYYPVEHFPDGAPGQGDSIPWLTEGGTEPEPVIYQSVWPQAVPTMLLSETVHDAPGQDRVPQITGNCYVGFAYQQSLITEDKPSAHLVDALGQRRVLLPGGLPDGFSFIRDLTPLLSARMGFDELSSELIFTGTVIPDSEALKPYVALNVMSKRERDELFNLELADAADTGPWQNAVDSLYAATRLPEVIAPLAPGEPVPQFEADDVALTTGFAEATGFVTIVFNDSEDCSDGSAGTTMAVIFVEDRVSPGFIDLVPPRSPFDFKVAMRHSGTFRDKLDEQDPFPQFRFEWQWVAADDLPPGSPLPNEATAWNNFTGIIPPNGLGAIDVGVNPANSEPTFLLADTWWRCRVTPVAAYGPWPAPTDPTYEWTDAAIMPGWIKRVLGRFDGFRQRVLPLLAGSPEAEALNKVQTLGATAEDKYDDYLLTRVNNIVSMIQQAGTRWEGDIPLTDQAANNVGLIELYETVFNLAMSQSLDHPFGIDARYDGSHPIHSSLLLVSGRLADLYTLLANEAYADASNPTIGIPSSGTPANLGNWGIAAPSVHCFQGQVSSLLKEELALLRGLDSGFGVNLEVNPYNKLRWNFTAGVLPQAEAAYALNYQIRDVEGELQWTIDAGDAQVLYPQGHGDAWGHYMTALKSYYRLLHHPDFKWKPRTEFIESAGESLEIDRMDERKFAEIAVSKARTGAEIMNLTYRENYTESPDEQWTGYKDEDPQRAWGVDDWARRTGLGTYVDWVMASAIMPPVPDRPDSAGIRSISRSNTDALDELAAQYRKIQKQLDDADQGLNPLGISKNTIPFNVTESLLAPPSGQLGQTHYEQQYAKTVTALNEAISLFNYANESTQALRNQADSMDALEENATDRELDFRNRLIDVFGRPYPNDPAYASGYLGPDLMHYAYVTQGPLTGAAQTDNVLEFEMQVNDFVYDARGLPDVNPDGSLKSAMRPVKFHVSTTANRFGFVVPTTWGERPAQGQIQQAQSELLLAKTRLEQGMLSYDDLILQIIEESESIEAQIGLNAEKINIQIQGQQLNTNLNRLIKDSQRRQGEFQKRARMATLIANAVSEAIPGVTGIIVGFANGVISDFLAPLRGGIQQAGNIVAEIFTQEANKETLVQLDHQQAKEIVQFETQLRLTTLENNAAIEQRLKGLRQLIRGEATRRLEVYVLQEQVRQASARYLTALQAGERLLEELRLFRRRSAEEIQTLRYKDILFRVFRNDALQKYRGAFDAAAQQVYLAALAYDYDTSISGDGPNSEYAAQDILERLVRERSIGRIEPGNPPTLIAGVGLVGVLKEMQTDWTELKDLIGINDPQPGVDPRFSLRYELFRVRNDEGIAVANKKWQQALRDSYVPDLYQIPEFNRYCKFATALPSPQPGLAIRFKTTIDQQGQLNFFGKDIAPFDQTFPTGRFATKILQSAVYFTNWQAANYSGFFQAFLVPAGPDVLRDPFDVSVERRFDVVNQVIKPFDLTDNVWEAPDWNPTIAGPQPFTQIKRFAPLKVNRDRNFGEEEAKDNQLAGRSATNDSWILFIPGTYFLSSDPNEGINRLIEGRTTATPGVRDGNGISDILLWFDTYSYIGAKKKSLDGEVLSVDESTQIGTPEDNGKPADN